MISFKLVSGFYHNLTYSSGEVVNLDFSKITESDIRWFEDSDNINKMHNSGIKEIKIYF